jgi:hypothetical protein
LKEDIDAAMPKFPKEPVEETTEPPVDPLATFALLRWDELPDLAGHLNSETTLTDRVNKTLFAKALRKIHRTPTDFFEYERDKDYERHR